LDELAFGAWSVLSLRDPSSLKSFFLRNRLFIGLAALTVAIVVSLGSSFLNGSQQLQSLAEVIDLFAFAASFAALLLSASLAGSESSLVKFLSLSPLRVYGKFSYFLYLFHWPILRALTIAIRLHDIPGTGRFGRLSGTIFFLAAFSFPLIAASLSWTLFEKQFLKLKHFFPANPVPRNVIN
jgi:peptidoglycan/LPS O-acetylase OafA/YrhL